MDEDLMKLDHIRASRATFDTLVEWVEGNNIDVQHPTQPLEYGVMVFDDAEYVLFDRNGDITRFAWFRDDAPYARWECDLIEERVDNIGTTVVLEPTNPPDAVYEPFWYVVNAYLGCMAFITLHSTDWKAVRVERDDERLIYHLDVSLITLHPMSPKEAMIGQMEHLFQYGFRGAGPKFSVAVPNEEDPSGDPVVRTIMIDELTKMLYKPVNVEGLPVIHYKDQAIWGFVRSHPINRAPRVEFNEGVLSRNKNAVMYHFTCQGNVVRFTSFMQNSTPPSFQAGFEMGMMTTEFEGNIDTGEVIIKMELLHHVDAEAKKQFESSFRAVLADFVAVHHYLQHYPGKPEVRRRRGVIHYYLG